MFDIEDIIFRARVEFEELTNLNTAFDETDEKARSVQGTIGQINNSLRSAAGSGTALGQALQTSQNTIGALRNQAFQLNQSLGNTSGSEAQRKLREELSRVNVELGKEVKNFESLQAAARNTGTSFNAVNQRSRGLLSGLRGFASAGGILNTAFGTLLSGGITAAISGITSAIQGVSRFIGESVEAAADYEQALANLSAITGVTGGGLADLSARAQDFSIDLTTANGSIVTIGQSAEDAANSFAVVGSQAPELLRSASAMEEVAKQATLLDRASSELSFADAVSALTTSSNQFKNAGDSIADTVARTGRLTNELATGAQLGSVGINGITEALTKFGGIANSQNVTTAESIALIEVLGESYGTAAEAGTAARNVITILAARTDELGISTKGANGEAQGLTGALDQLAEANLSAGELTKIFGRENLLAAQRLIDTRDRTKELTAAIRENGNANFTSGEAARQAAVQADTLRNSQEQLALSFDRLQVGLGSALTPLVRSFTDASRGAVDALSDWLAVDMEDTIRAQQRELGGLVTQLGIYNEAQAGSNEVTQEQRDLVERINEIYPGFAGNLDLTTLSASQLRDELRLVNQAYESQIELVGILGELEEAEAFLEQQVNRRTRATIQGTAAFADLQRAIEAQTGQAFEFNFDDFFFQSNELQQEAQRLRDEFVFIAPEEINNIVDLATALGQANSQFINSSNLVTGATNELTEAQERLNDRSRVLAERELNLGRSFDQVNQSLAATRSAYRVVNAAQAEAIGTGEKLNVILEDGSEAYLTNTEGLRSLASASTEQGEKQREVERAAKRSAQEIERLRKEQEKLRESIGDLLEDLPDLQERFNSLSALDPTAGAGEIGDSIGALRGELEEIATSPIITREQVENAKDSFTQLREDLQTAARAQKLALEAEVILAGGADSIPGLEVLRAQAIDRLTISPEFELLNTDQQLAQLDNLNQQFNSRIRRLSEDRQEEELDLLSQGLEDSFTARTAALDREVQAENQALADISDNTALSLADRERLEEESRQRIFAANQRFQEETIRQFRTAAAANAEAIAALQDLETGEGITPAQQGELDARIEAQREFNTEIIALEKELTDAKIEEDERRREAQEESSEETLNLEKSRIDAVLGGSSRLVSAFGELLEANSKKRIALAGGDEARIAEIERKAFERKKAIALVNLAIDTAQAVVGSLAKFGGLPINIPFIIGTAAIQAGIIASQTFPGFYEGSPYLDPDKLKASKEKTVKARPGHGGKDAIPAYLKGFGLIKVHAGERIVTAAKNRKYGAVLDAIEKGDLDPEILERREDRKRSYYIDPDLLRSIEIFRKPEARKRKVGERIAIGPGRNNVEISLQEIINRDIVPDLTIDKKIISSGSEANTRRAPKLPEIDIEKLSKLIVKRQYEAALRSGSDPSHPAGKSLERLEESERNTLMLLMDIANTQGKLLKATEQLNKNLKNGR